MPKKITFNKDAIRKLRQVIVPFFRSPVRKKAWGWLLSLVLLLITVSGVNVLMSYAARDFMSALAERRETDFFHSLYLYLGTFALAVPITVFYRYSEERLAVLWREWMTDHLIKRYFFRRAYYTLRDNPEIDNPDQRIAEDVRNFTATSLSFLLIMLNSTLTLFAFVGVLYSISLPLVGTLLLYSLVGTVGTFIIGRRLVRLHFRQYRREATLRYGLIRVRENAESIAFYRGEGRERSELHKKVLSVVNNTLLIIRWNRTLGFFTTSYNYLALLLPTVIVAPLYLRGEVQFGVVTQAGSAFAQVLAALSVLIVQFERLSAFTAGVSRLGSLWEALDAKELAEVDDDPIIESTEMPKGLKLNDVTVRTPDGKRELIQNLSLALTAGTSLLITGESGAGKSSLLRTIAGLWNRGQGEIQRPKLQDMMFLPQRPYMIEGSLRAQLMYPYPEKSTKKIDRELMDVLTKVNMDKVLERTGGSLDKQYDWSNILSLGEQQRISFARLLFRKPLVAFLDEATSALDEPNEELLYGLLNEKKQTFISVGHRSTLRAFHKKELHLAHEGKWELGDAVAVK